MFRYWLIHALFLYATLILVACTPETENSTTGTPAPAEESENPPLTDDDGDLISQLKQGFGLPKNLEVIPAKREAFVTQKAMSLKKALKRINSTVADAPTDLEKSQTHTRISERSLDRFQIIDTILEALSQTRYDDPRNIGAGPYRTMLKFEDGSGSGLESWIIKSKMIVMDGNPVNKVEAWIEEDEGLIKAEFLIFEAASSSRPYGRWQLNAGFYDQRGLLKGHFVTHVEVNNFGESVIRINQADVGGEHPEDTRGILYLTNQAGRGSIEYTDWEHNEGEELRLDKKAQYAYNSSHVLIHSDGENHCRDRQSYHDITMDYQVFNQAGTLLNKIYDFSFPVKHTDENGKKRYYYYSSWQGKHQLWGDHGSDPQLPVGTQLSSAHVRDGEPILNYSVESIFQGHMNFKEWVVASLEDLYGLHLEWWTSDHFNLRFDPLEGRWERCNGPRGSWDCSTTEEVAYDLSNLRNDDSQRRHVYIGSDFGELQVNEEGSGFDGVDFGDSEAFIWVGINSPRYLQYLGSGWIEYDVTYDHRGDPIFGASYPFAFDQSGNYHLHTHGLSFQLSYDALTGIPLVLKENVRLITESSEELGLLMAFPLRDNEGATFSFDGGRMMLINEDGEVVTDSKWDLRPVLPEGAPDLNLHFTWEYDKFQDEPWKRITYLADVEGARVILDPPVRFKTIRLGDRLVGGLNYSGHLSGIPHAWELLHENNWEISDHILQRIVEIPEMQLEDGQHPGVHYTIGPHYRIRFLENVPLEDCQLVLGDEVPLENIPAFVEPVMGDVPLVEEIKVSEGVFL